MSTTVSHIRKRYPRNTGNSRYLDRRTFDSGKWLTWTFCGAEVTDRDIAWKSRNTKDTRTWEHTCPECLAAVDKEQS